MFERECIAEYAETVKTVCFDGAYYTWPTEKNLAGLAEQVTDDFRFAFKVTDLPEVLGYRNGKVYFQDYSAGSEGWIWYVRREIVSNRGVQLCRADDAAQLKRCEI